MCLQNSIGSEALTQHVLKEATLTTDGQKHTLHMDCDYFHLEEQQLSQSWLFHKGTAQVIKSINSFAALHMLT